MNCCITLTEEEKEMRRANRKIEKSIKVEKQKCYKNVSLLLLGTGESGKSTFMKQMKIIHEDGFDDKVKSTYIQHVYSNIFISMQSMIRAMDMLNIKYDFPEIMDSVHLISSTNAEIATLDSLKTYALKKLWAFNGIQETFNRRREYQLSDSTEYFFKNIKRIADPNYLPSEEDILRVRVQTQGVEEYKFLSKEYNIKIIDIAGQRSQRTKWFNLFDKCNSMIFLTAISEYDQVLVEADNINRLRESIVLFGKIVNHHIFNKKSNVLFLNKNDILEKKIQYSNLADYFPEYDGQERDVISARLFIQKQFTNQKEDISVGGIYAFITCATDTQNIKNVFQTVRTSIIALNLTNVFN